MKLVIVKIVVIRRAAFLLHLINVCRIAQALILVGHPEIGPVALIRDGPAGCPIVSYEPGSVRAGIIHKCGCRKMVIPSHNGNTVIGLRLHIAVVGIGLRIRSKVFVRRTDYSGDGSNE